MSRRLTISGWGQKANSLTKLFKEESDFLDYLPHDEKFIFDFAMMSQGKYDEITAWSLGGQIAIKIANMIGVKKLNLIAVPFNFVNFGEYNIGIDQEIFAEFQSGLKSNPEKILKKFNRLIVHGDSNSKQILPQLENADIDPERLIYWLNFLKNCDLREDVISLPETVILQGKEDKIVNYQQALLFREYNPNIIVKLIDNAAHAPHLHYL